MEIKDRLALYLKDKRLSIREFERRCGLSNGVAGRISSTTQPSTLNKIAASSDLNLDWLFTGQGNMLKGTDQVSKEKLIPFYDAETHIHMNECRYHRPGTGHLQADHRCSRHL